MCVVYGTYTEKKHFREGVSGTTMAKIKDELWISTYLVQYT